MKRFAVLSTIFLSALLAFAIPVLAQQEDHDKPAQEEEKRQPDVKPPKPEEKSLRMEDYVLDFIPDSVRAVQQDSGEADVSLIGYCFGGVLSLLYGSIFPPVWNFQLALHTRGYGTCITTLHLQFEAEVRQLLGIPETYAQGCLLPVGRLRAGHTFRPAIRRPVEEVVALNRWDGPGL